MDLPKGTYVMSEATHNEPDVTQLAKDWLTVKAAEDHARKRRIEIEQDMLPFLDQKPEGSQTTELPTGAKVTVTNKLTRKLDLAGFDTVAGQIPAELHPIKVERKPDEKGIKWLQANAPEIYKLIAPHLTVTPAKPGVKVVAPTDPEAE